MYQPFFPLCPVQDLCQIQQGHGQGQLKEIVAVPAYPAQGSFRQQLVFEQAQQQLGIRITPVPDDGADLLYALRGTEE